MGFFEVLPVAMSTNDFRARSGYGLVFMLDPEPTGGRGRTDTLLRVLDFESSASANSATPALCFLSVYSGTEFAQLENAAVLTLWRWKRRSSAMRHFCDSNIFITLTVDIHPGHEVARGWLMETTIRLYPKTTGSDAKRKLR